MEIMVDLAEDLFFPASLVVGNIMRGERDLNREYRSRVQPRNETQNQTAAVLDGESTVGINARSERGRDMLLRLAPATNGWKLKV